MQHESGDVFEVVVRFRPLNEREKRELRDYAAAASAADDDDDDDDEQSAADAAVDSILSLYSPTTFEFDGKAYTFDRVFGCDTSQLELYDAVVGPLVRRFVEQPHDATIVAYGQTSSGKTWTIDGDWYGGVAATDAANDDAGDLISPGAGILPRALRAIFSLLDNQQRLLVEFSFYEIYCDRIIDLQQASGATTAAVQLFDDRKTGKVFAKNLSWTTVRDVRELLARLRECRERRHYAYTAMNANSSRSHTIFDLRLSTRVGRGGGEAAAAGSPQRYKNFRVVDLAGSERASRTKASGVTFEEGKKINQSLMDLRSVIAQLSRPTAGASSAVVVNHRASKLTRILYPSFRGGSRVVVLACCSPALDSRSETYGTLQFACHAKRIALKLDDIKPRATADAAAVAARTAEERVREMAEEAAERERRIEAYKSEMEELRALVMCAKTCATCGEATRGATDSDDAAVSPSPPPQPRPPVVCDAATQVVIADAPPRAPVTTTPQPPPAAQPLTCDADYSSLNQRYFVLLERERERARRYKATVDMQKKMLQQKIADNELLDQELQMLRMLKNIIMQEF